MGVWGVGMGRGPSMLKDPEAKGSLNTLQELKAGQGDQRAKVREDGEQDAAERWLLREGGWELWSNYLLSKKRKSEFRFYSFAFRNV